MKKADFKITVAFINVIALMAFSVSCGQQKAAKDKDFYAKYHLKEGKDFFIKTVNMLLIDTIPLAETMDCMAIGDMSYGSMDMKTGLIFTGNDSTKKAQFFTEISGISECRSTIELHYNLTDSVFELHYRDKSFSEKCKLDTIHKVYIDDKNKKHEYDIVHLTVFSTPQIVFTH
ncbi:MAG: hypothetical protein LBS01_09425 [Prevotellaceae bacterium]|jgi:hypothetical protein|nr:hypothetical protein [Prevotellaceae bacterium]